MLHTVFRSAGGLDALRQRLTEDMLATNDLSVRQAQASADDDVAGGGISKNNYNRPGGNQNLGNRITDRPSSKVLAPPGGASQVRPGGVLVQHSLWGLHLQDRVYSSADRSVTTSLHCPASSHVSFFSAYPCFAAELW